MRAYSGSFHYAPKNGDTSPQLEAEWLEARFQERSERSRFRKQQYAITLQFAAILAIALPLAATQIDFQRGTTNLYAEIDQEVVTLQDIAQTVQQTLPPPPPRPSVPIVVPDDELPDDSDLDFDASLDLAADVELTPPPAQENEEEAFDEPEIFVVVEDMPEMIGGAASLAASVTYPPIARQAGLQGLVVVKIVVNSDGTPSDPIILRSPGKALESAAIEAVMKQEFTPGRQRGRAVAAYMAIPVRFQLSSI